MSKVQRRAQSSTARRLLDAAKVVSLGWKLLSIAASLTITGVLIGLFRAWWTQAPLVARGFMVLGVTGINASVLLVAGGAVVRRWQDRKKLPVSVKHDNALRFWVSEHTPKGAAQHVIGIYGLTITNLSRTDDMSIEIIVHMGNEFRRAVGERLDVESQKSATVPYIGLDGGLFPDDRRTEIDALTISLVLLDHISRLSHTHSL